MSFIDFGLSKGLFQLHATHKIEKENVFRFSFFNIVLPALNITNEKDTINGYVAAESEEPVTFQNFIDLCSNNRKFHKDTYFIQRMIPNNEKDVVNPIPFVNVEFSYEPVLIDPDYKNMVHIVQICFNGPDVLKFQQSTILPTLQFEIEAFEPSDQPLPWIYSQPLFSNFHPSHEDEFHESFLFARKIVTDFYLLKNSKHAAGVDIDLEEVIDNSKDFKTIGEYESTILNQIVVPAKYSIELYFPEFFKHPGEWLNVSSMFMLRSRASKRGLSLSMKKLNGDEKHKTLILELHNFNLFDVVLTKDKVTGDKFPMRVVQFVPGAHMYSHLLKMDTDERQKFFGISLIENMQERKAKI
jgi:hypothetical protein